MFNIQAVYGKLNYMCEMDVKRVKKENSMMSWTSVLKTLWEKTLCEGVNEIQMVSAN